MHRRSLILILCTFAVVCATAGAEQPDAASIIERTVEAAGGNDALAQLGVVQIVLDEQENMLDGTTKTKKTTCFVDASNLTNMRLELPGDVIVVRTGNTGWAKMAGELDDRPQTPKMAFGTINQKLIPLLMPFSLTAPGVKALAAVESSFEGTPSWRVAVAFPKDYFISPSMNTSWHLEVSQSDYRLLTAEFQPPMEYSKEGFEGVRYRALRTTELNGVRLPAEVLVDGIDRTGSPTGHTRIAKLEITIRGPFEPTLFLHPKRLEALEEGMEP